MKKELNKWQTIFSFGRDFVRYERGWKHLVFGVFKFVEFPDDIGERLQKRHYKGFIIDLYVFIPIEFD